MRKSSNESDYIKNLFAQEDKVLGLIRENLIRDKKWGINISASEGKLLQLLLNLVSAERVVEVGTLYGYSTLWMARALPKDGVIYTFEKSKENSQEAQSLLKQSSESSKVQFFLGDAFEELNKIKEPVDVFFIDADKVSYLKYLEFAERLVKKGGLIIGDNTFLFGHMFGEGRSKVSQEAIEVMQKFNERLSDKQKYQSIIIPTFEGMTVAKKLY